MLVCQLFTARKNRIFVLFRRGGASRVVNKAYRVTEAIAGVGKKPTLTLQVQCGSMSPSLPITATNLRRDK